MKPAHQIRRQRGFSLIEMMIATVIFVLLCAAAFALLSLAQQRYQTESQVLNSFQEARFGLDEIVRDVNGSGYPPANSFSFSPNAPPANLYASTPVAWDSNYQSNLPCQIGTGGGGTCTTPGDFDVIIERDVDPWRRDGVEWTRYQLQGNILYRGQTYKSTTAEPDVTTAPAFVPYVQNVMNNDPTLSLSASQLTQFRATYPNMFPGGNPVPIFQYTCYTPTGPQPCPSAVSYNSPVNVTDIEITLIVMAPTVDAQTGQPRLIELQGRGHSLNPIQ
jgi:prepilin-type N-terminal cleavage/methylation domain-containing protein